MTLEDSFIEINKAHHDVFSVEIRKQGTTLLEVNYKVIEKYWEYFTDKFLLQKVIRVPRYDFRTIVELQEDKK